MRWTYNKCVSLGKGEINVTKKILRKSAINSETLADTPWAREVPYDIRDAAMIDYFTAYWTNIKKKTAFVMKYKSKKDNNQSFTLHKKHWKTKRGYYSFLPQIISAESIPKMKCDSKVVRNRLGEYYLCIPEPVTAGENQACEKVIALDPGVRTFQTSYDNTGMTTKWGDCDMGRICRLSYDYDRLFSRCTKVNHLKRRSLRKAMLRINDKIRRIVADLHRKLAKWLCSNYNLILLPSFETQQMLKKFGRKINSKAAKAMSTWSHYKFKQHLLNKSREYANCEVVICTEEYTTKTCGSCGELHNKIGAAKTFMCPHCDFVGDRDINGARNILIKYLTQRVGN